MNYTKEITLTLNHVWAVKEFVLISNQQDFTIDVCSVDRHYCIDAKSLMGLFSLDLSVPIIVATKASGAEVDAYFDLISKFSC